ncbi:hypothetical protein C9439_00185 [archaeon SCG-AAA382B04]|nr:hypothetical protein C9439_00185 [archaeon SCG-AAA382B04]
MDVLLIESNNKAMEARFIEKNPKTRKRIKQNLPISGYSKLYKEEVYFSTQLDLDKEDATQEVEKGDIGFWQRGDAICFFYGQTDPVSPINVFAKIKEGLKEFRKINEGDKIKLTKN